MTRILIIDDDAEVRALMRLTLERAGFEVAEARDGEEGVQAFRQQAADLIFCDVFMPGKDGLEVIQELRRDFPGVKVIAMSGGGYRGTMALLDVARHLGAIEALSKPFSVTDAVAAARRALEP
jgi:CheY-like chemotaxis protein